MPRWYPEAGTEDALTMRPELTLLGISEEVLSKYFPGSHYRVDYVCYKCQAQINGELRFIKFTGCYRCAASKVTVPGFVYQIRRGSLHKVGVTGENSTRLRQFSGQGFRLVRRSETINNRDDLIKREALWSNQLRTQPGREPTELEWNCCLSGINEAYMLEEC